MSFEDVFRRVVIDCTSHSYVPDAIDRGQGDFLDPDVAFTYVRKNAPLHYGVLRELFRTEFERQRPPEIVTVLDFGCGPATAAVALRDAYVDVVGDTPGIRYYGLDHSPTMLDFAERFLNASELYEEPRVGYFLSTHPEECTREQLSQINDGRLIVIVASYLFKQRSLTVDEVDAFAALAARVVRAAPHDTPIFLLSVDAAFQDERQLWRRFLLQLRDGVAEGDGGRRLRIPRTEIRRTEHFDYLRWDDASSGFVQHARASREPNVEIICQYLT